VKPDEAAFETFIADWLVAHGGYQASKNDKEQGDPRDFDPTFGLDRPELFTFIGATQAEGWAEIIRRRGGDPDTAQAKFLDRVVGRSTGGEPSTCCGTAWWIRASRSGSRTSGRHTRSRPSWANGMRPTG